MSHTAGLLQWYPHTVVTADLLAATGLIGTDVAGAKGLAALLCKEGFSVVTQPMSKRISFGLSRSSALVSPARGVWPMTRQIHAALSIWAGRMLIAVIISHKRHASNAPGTNRPRFPL